MKMKMRVLRTKSAEVCVVEETDEDCDTGNEELEDPIDTDFEKDPKKAAKNLQRTQ